MGGPAYVAAIRLRARFAAQYGLLGVALGTAATLLLVCVARAVWAPDAPLVPILLEIVGHILVLTASAVVGASLVVWLHLRALPKEPGE